MIFFAVSVIIGGNIGGIIGFLIGFLVVLIGGIIGFFIEIFFIDIDDSGIALGYVIGIFIWGLIFFILWFISRVGWWNGEDLLYNWGIWDYNR